MLCTGGLNVGSDYSGMAGNGRGGGGGFWTLVVLQVAGVGLRCCGCSSC